MILCLPPPLAPAPPLPLFLLFLLFLPDSPLPRPPPLYLPPPPSILPQKKKSSVGTLWSRWTMRVVALIVFAMLTITNPVTTYVSSPLR